jgi:hypothetical protein
VRGEEKKSSQKKPTWAEEMEKNVNLSLPPWLAQGQGGTKKVHHPSTLVHWLVLVHSGPFSAQADDCFHTYQNMELHPYLKRRHIVF